MNFTVYNLCLCGDEIEPSRWSLGYRECLRCGDRTAKRIKSIRDQSCAPAYNKGAYQPVFSREDALLIGRK